MRTRGFDLTARFITLCVLLAAMGTVGASVATAAATDGLVGWWRFDEASGTAIQDSSGMGNTGTITGTVTRVSGKVGGAVTFATGAAIRGANPGNGFPSGSGARTIMAWVKIASGKNGLILVYGSTATQGSGPKTMEFSASVLQNGYSEGYLSLISNIYDDKWHHFAAVYEGPATNTVRLYLDGQLDQFGALSPAPNTGSDANWVIGKENVSSSTSGTFQGAVDELRLYNRALSADEIQAIVVADGGQIASVPLQYAQTMTFKKCNSTPGVITDVAYGEVVDCEIESLGNVDKFRFVGRAGERVWLSVKRDYWTARHCFRVTDPAGETSSWTCSSCPYNSCSYWGYDTSIYGDLLLNRTGPYIIEVANTNADATYPYSIGLKRLSPLPAGSAPLTYFQPASSALRTKWDWHYYALHGTAGDKLTVTLRRTVNDASHCATLYAPTGVEIYTDCSTCPYNSCSYWGHDSTLSRELTLNSSGLHVLRVLAGNENNTFGYSLNVGCSGTCDSTPLPPPSQTCDYFLSPPSILLGSQAAGGILGISAPMGCPWAVTSNASFLRITTEPSGGGTDTIGFTVDQNTSAAYRTATVMVAGLKSTVTQLGSSPMLTVTPSTSSFSLRAGSADLAYQVLSLYTNATSLAYTASATMTDAPGLLWLKISQTSGSAPGSLVVTVDPSRLPPGTFTGNVTIKASAASPTEVKIPITVKTQTAGTGQISVQSDAITFALVANGPDGMVQRVVSNVGSSWLSYTVAVESAATAGWLKVSPNGGSVRNDTSETLTITASPSGMAPGTYSSAIVVTGGGKTIRIPVTMTVGPGTAKILLSQTGLTFTGVAGGGNPAPQTIGILNEGAGELNWTAQAVTLSGANWLQLSSGGGRVERPLLDVSPLEISVNTSRLDPGDHYGKIVITGDAANSPQTVTVLVTVLPRGSNPGPEIRPTGLIFIGAPGAKPGAQALKVTNVISQPVSFTSSQLTFDGGTWLSQSPLKATVAPNNPGQIDVQSDNKGLTAGIRRGVLTLLFEDGRSANVNVLNVVAPQAVAGSKDALVEKWASSCQSPDLRVQFVSLRDSYQLVVGQPAAIEAKIADDCGNLLVPETGASTVASASFSNGDPEVRLTHQGNGQWSGTWRPANLPEGTSTVTVTVRAAYVRLGSQQTMQTGTAQLAGTLRSGSAPIVMPGALLHAASFAASAPVAPGGLVTLFGANMADKASGAGSYPLPSTLEGTEVMLGGQALPLLYSSAGQINAQVPYGLTPNTQHQVVVRRGSVLSVPEPFTVAAAQPGIFTKNMQGTGQGIIMKSDQLTMAEAATPASRGEVIVIYCSGLGAVTPAVKEGEAATVAARTVNETTLTIGGVKAEVLYAGVTPGFAGLYQINATVPASVPVGNEVTVVATVAGQVSNTVTMAVK